MRKYLVTICVFALMLTCVSSVFAGESANNEAVVSVIQGTARMYTKKDHAGHVLKKGDRVGKDTEISVEEKSRLALLLPDGSVMRFSEKTRVKMSELVFNPETKGKSVKVGLSIGKIWSKVRKLTTADSTVEIRTANAVAGVRGTVYRVNVDQDSGALIKVYDGSVSVGNPPPDAAGSSKPASLAPHEVAGPHSVPPPYHEVSREEWTAIVTAMQQISISPQGVPSKPQKFDPKADADDWVKWNQELDKKAGF